MILDQSRHIAAALALSATLFAANRNWIPDETFRGSSLNGWTKSGEVNWKAENGEIVGIPETVSGGWLMLDKGYQDVALYTSFKCAAGCKAGILLRAEKSGDGMKGVFVSLSEGDVASYEVKLDHAGNEVSRTKLGPGPAPLLRMATMRPTTEEAVPGFSKPAPTREEADAAAEAKRLAAPSTNSTRRGNQSVTSVPNGEWHTVSITLDVDVLALAINDRRAMNGSTTDRMMGYGPIALYAGGNGEVRFKELSYKDLNPKFEPKETVSPKFRMQRLSDFYYGWCAAAADINRDGTMDLISGPFYYLGPDYTTRREFTTSRTYNPSNQFAQAMVNFAHDFTGDGWPDILVVDQRPIYLYVNPKGESRRWDRYNVVPNATTEIELLRDIDGDGRPEVLFAAGGMMAYANPDPANPTGPWVVHPISEKTNISPHGMGIGDVNGDGRMDVLGPRGWWEQPPKGSTQGPWTFHAAAFGNGGAEMGVYDVNGDGLNDVVTALSAHGWGLAWFEQKRDPQGTTSFVQHDIMGDFTTKNAGDVTFSEPHGMTFADVDGDGMMDIIVGKRSYSHLESYTDPDPYGPAVLYWYRTVRNPKAEGGAEFVPELIHNRSGVGSHLAAVDMNKDGRVDILTSTNRGAFIFWNEMSKKKTLNVTRR